MATRLPPAPACSRNSLLCHPLIYSPRLLYLCHPNAQKNNVHTHQSYITFYLAIWLVTTCIALFLLDAGTKKLFGSLASFSVHPFVSCFLFYFILVLSLLFLLIISPRSFSFSDDDDDDDDGVNNYDAEDGDDDVDGDDDGDDDDGSWQPPPSHPLILLQPSLSRPQITSQENKPLICLLILHGA